MGEGACATVMPSDTFSGRSQCCLLWFVSWCRVIGGSAPAARVAIRLTSSPKSGVRAATPAGQGRRTRPVITLGKTWGALGSALWGSFGLGLGQQQNDQPDEDHHCTEQPHGRQVGVAGIDVEAA